ncbi:MAG: hypothetical protein L0206_00005, partial [Actinobacteria bacterium]|nr:hypothetical protein [Actinomycetota bacterium]
ELALHTMKGFPQGRTFSGATGYSASELVRFYADPGSAVRLAAFRDSQSGEARFTWTISGYLVEV